MVDINTQNVEIRSNLAHICQKCQKYAISTVKIDMYTSKMAGLAAKNVKYKRFCQISVKNDQTDCSNYGVQSNISRVTMLDGQNLRYNED